jgi:hypothetical protein
MRESSFFEHITQIPAPWQDGSVPLPTFYYDAMAIHASFLASADRVRPFLPSPRLHPFRVAPGRCAVALAALSYRETDLGPYNEVLIGIPCTLDEHSPQFTGILRSLPDVPMIYVHRLPVTTEIARGPGVHFLAAPKFLADITFEETEEWVRCRLAEKGTDILTLEVQKGELEPAGRWSVSFLTARDGHLLRLGWVESEQRKRESHASSDARLELGPHPIAEELRKMHLGRVLSCEYRPRFQAVLSPVVESFVAEPGVADELEVAP